MNRKSIIQKAVQCLLWGIGLGLPGCAEPPAIAPSIHVSQSSIDLGTVPLTDEHLEFDYLIENWGTAPLRITGTILSCGCTRPEIPQSDILPSQSARVRLRIDPEAAGEKRVSVTLLTNDPLQPKFALFAHWITTNGISVTPANLDFGEVKPGELTNQIVTLSKLDDRIRVQSVTGEPGAIQATLNGEKLTVSLIPEPYPISGSGVVRLILEGGKTRPFLIPVAWHVDHAYQAHPSSLFLGYTQPGRELEGVVHIKDRQSQDIEVDHWEWMEELPGARCESSHDEVGRHQFSVKWTAPMTSGLHRGVVLLQVSDHQIQIPVSALVGTAAK